MTVTNVVGQGRQKGVTEVYRGAKEAGGLINKVRLDIAVNEAFVEPTIAAVTKGAHTGSVGDGQRWAEALGHRVLPSRPGLVGFEVEPSVLKGRIGTLFEKVMVDIAAGGKTVAQTRGGYEIEKWGIGGTAITDASRIVVRQRLEKVELHIQLADGRVETIRPLRTRPIKEAMVTIGGVALDEVDSCTMESKKVPGLYFAGELLDIDGPTGGYNLQAAFSSARLAVAAVGKRCGKGEYAPLEKPAQVRRRRGNR